MVPWAEVTVGVAAVVALVYVTTTMRKLQRDTLTFLGNHLSSNTAVQASTSVAMASTATVLATLAERVDRLHDDNVEQARLLKHDDKHVTRKVEEQNDPAVNVVSLPGDEEVH